MVVLVSKVAILGGTFDPVHYGHIEMAEIALRELNVDIVLFVPAGEPPFKEGATGSGHRLRMLELAIEGRPNIGISNVEVDREGKSFTIDTLDILDKKFTDTFLLIGADKLNELPRWKDAERLLRTYTIAVLPRVGYNLTCVESLRKKYSASIIELKTAPRDISSTQIRTSLRLDRDAQDLIPARVLDYIKRNNLYLQGDSQNEKY